MLSAQLSKRTLRTLKDLHKAIHTARENGNATVKVEAILLDVLTIASFADSSWANAPGAKSQAGVVIFATTPEFFQNERAATALLDWHSRKIAWVCASTFQAETYASAEG